jgi:hypothetical protein
MKSYHVRKETKMGIDFATYTLTYEKGSNRMYFDFAVANKVESGSLTLKSKAFSINKTEVVNKTNDLLTLLKDYSNSVVVMYPKKVDVSYVLIDSNITLESISKLRILTSCKLTESIKNFLINKGYTFVKKTTIDGIPTDISSFAIVCDDETPAPETALSEQAHLERSEDNINVNEIGQNDEP